MSDCRVGRSVKVILPQRSEDALSEGLRGLTERIHKAGLADASARGIFGGEFGYGVEFSNDIFLMHQYCWCEKDDCLWCAGCPCSNNVPEHYVDGERVSQEAFGAANRACFGDLWEFKAVRTEAEYDEHRRRAAIRDSRLKTVLPAIQHSCGQPMMADRPRGGDIIQEAPHFWHKPSGLRVWWYKWIGRSMEIHNPNAAGVDAVLRECGRSLT